MQDVHQAWGRNIERHMLRAGMTRSQLAGEVDTAKSTITRILDGTRPPSDELKYRLAAVFAVHMDILFPWPSEMPRRYWLVGA